MQLQQKPTTIEAVLWTGATFSEWPEWIKVALLKKPSDTGRLYTDGTGDLYMITGTSVTKIEPGKYLVYQCGSIYLDTFENLSQMYNRLNSSGRPVELKQVDACDITLQVKKVGKIFEEEDNDDDGPVSPRDPFRG